MLLIAAQGAAMVGSRVLTAAGLPTYGQNGADPNFNPNVARPAYRTLPPKVLLDEAHNNADTSRGSYKPFADLIKSDGYRVVPNTRRFSSQTLTGYKVLVVVNPADPPGQTGGSSFSDAELDAVVGWVKRGGSLLLISDHARFSVVSSVLSRRFEVDITNGYTIDPVKYNKESEDQTELVFSRDNGLLVEHPITRGRDASEQIRKVITFTGTSLKGPQKSVAFLRLSDTAKDVLPPDQKPSASPEEPLPDHKPVSASGRAQGIAMSYGLGKVVVLGDAAMLTAQIGSRGYRFGMNVAGADNRQLALNIMHWLSSLLR